MRSEKIQLIIKMTIVAMLLGFGAIAAVQSAPAPQADEKKVGPALQDARKVTAELTDKVRGLLLKELEKGGYEGAVDVCANVAQSITRDFNKKTGHSVRRVSLGYRNLNDAPDEYEQKLLERFDRENREKKLQSEYYEVVSEQGRQYLRYAKPLIAAKMCLNCHGQLDEIAPRVRTILQRHYPDDKATGYHEGDVRGAVSVKIALP